ncbi:hypothetical protein SESBI_25016 [Sesbania bispinosa]|nr:hypothetical protein SESBI_25016 [Sesbania bispinosa]
MEAPLWPLRKSGNSSMKGEIKTATERACLRWYSGAKRQNAAWRRKQQTKKIEHPLKKSQKYQRDAQHKVHRKANGENLW